MYNESEEIRQAIRAGEAAKASLQKALEAINSARAWGIVDILGGNLISGLVKHSKVGDARYWLSQAQHNVRAFQNELRDVQGIEYISADVGSIFTFADFFLDGLVADFLVQARINETRRQIEAAIPQIDNVLYQLGVVESRQN